MLLKNGKDCCNEATKQHLKGPLRRLVVVLTTGSIRSGALSLSDHCCTFILHKCKKITNENNEKTLQFPKHWKAERFFFFF